MSLVRRTINAAIRDAVGAMLGMPGVQFNRHLGLDAEFRDKFKGNFSSGVDVQTCFKTPNLIRIEVRGFPKMPIELRPCRLRRRWKTPNADRTRGMPCVAAASARNHYRRPEQLLFLHDF